MLEIVCSKCGSQPESEVEWKCDRCGGAFSMHADDTFRVGGTILSDRSLWRYREVLPKFAEDVLITMGEGFTPLIPLGEGDASLKLDFVNPTGSFKDRGSTVMVSWVKNIASKVGIETICEDSSGNAGASVAAYSARAGLNCTIYAPEKVSEAKAKQISSYGAELKKVKGSREDVAKAAQERVEGSLYVSHVWNPYFMEGTKTLAYEVAEALGWKSPEYIFLPVSAGTLLLGVLKGFNQLVDADVIPRLPKIIACQALKVSPLYHAYYDIAYTPPEQVDSVADALITLKPIRLNEMLDGLRKVSGECEVVTDEEIIRSVKELGRKGVYVEPSAAVPYASWRKWTDRRRLKPEDEAIIVLTGSGFKSQISI